MYTVHRATQTCARWLTPVTTQRCRETSGLALERQAGADPQQDDADHAPPADPDLVGAEPSVAVDRRARRELAGEQDRDGRDHADARAGDRDREHDDDAHQRAAPEPDGLARSRRELTEA